HGAELAEAAAAELRDSLGYYPNWAATTPTVVALVERVLALAPEGMSRVFFTSGGSEAVESAWKLARQHFLARGEPQRRKVASRGGSSHACRLGALPITGIPMARAPFEPLLGDVRHVQSTDPRTCLRHRGLEPCTAECADAFEQAILAEGPGTVAMVILE